MKDSFKKVFGSKNRILVVMAHPDDTELYAGGTVARLTKEGKEVRVIKMTYGEKGCKQDDIPEAKLKKIRKKEDRTSMNILGISDENNVYLDLGDGSVKNNMETIEKVVRQIRIFKPDLIITHNPEDRIIRFDKDENWLNHRDHLHTGIIAIDAAYPYSRDISFFPEQLKDSSLSSHSCIEFLFVDYYYHPDNVLIDITGTVDTRVRAHSAHSSQYSLEHAQDFADFFTKLPEYPKGKLFEKFRYVMAD